MELNDYISELKDSIGEVLVNIAPEMCRQVMLSVRRRLQLCVQSDGQYFGNLCKVSNLLLRQEGHQLAIFLEGLPFLQKSRRFCELVSLPL